MNRSTLWSEAVCVGKDLWDHLTNGRIPVSDASEAKQIPKAEAGNNPWPSCLRVRLSISCLLLMSASCITVCAKAAFCSDQPPENPIASTSAAQSTAVAELTKRPVTVADSIQMTRLGDLRYTDGSASSGIVAKFSPDGKHFVVILKKGNLERNTNEYSLVLFQTAELFQSPKPRVVVSLASSSNRPAIDNVFWLDDNDTLLFLGERSGEQTQLYSLKCSSKELTKLTSSTTALTLFVATPNGEKVVYTARNAVPFLTDSVSRRGISVTNEWVTDLIRGSYEGNEVGDVTLFIKQVGKESKRLATQGRIQSLYSEMSLSPDGAHLLLKTEATRVSSAWSEYDDKFLQVLTRHGTAPGGHTSIYQYELVDTHTGASQVLVDTPIGSFGSEIAWSPDSKSVVVSDVYLPLNVDDPAERALRKEHAFLVEFRISDRQFVKVSQDDVRLLNWDPRSGYLVCDMGRIDSLTGKTTPKAYFRKSGDLWSKASFLGQPIVPSVPDIVLDEGMNTPPRIVAVDAPTGRKSLVMDLNPQFQNLRLARVEECKWKDSWGNEVKGGLYWPLDYVVGKKYSLVLQTHGWYTDRFWMDGPYTTAFAAQALAGRGFFVLQVDDPDWHIWDTPKEAPRAAAAYYSAIDYLNRRGLIDPSRVGIIGFSRTYWHVTYALTHPKRHFAAAALADGVDFGYFQYMAFSNEDQGTAAEYAEVNGGPPFGEGLSRMLKQSPSFLMDRLETPLRIQTLGPISLLSDWQWYSGLSLLGKPVEMIYIPEGTHILEKPWDRMISQQGDVDWFCFWLNGQEDPDPAKAEQYTHWRELRSLKH
jgi:hypothetical protein